MPAPRLGSDNEGVAVGRRPAWWRRAVAATLRTMGRAADGRRRNRAGTYRELGREAREAARRGQVGGLFRD